MSVCESPEKTMTYCGQSDRFIRKPLWTHHCTRSEYPRPLWCLEMYVFSPRLESLRKAPVTLSRLEARPFPTLLVGRGRVKSVGGQERSVAGLARS